MIKPKANEPRPTKPQSICCYLCGREFGTKGFAFHYKQCQSKFTTEQDKLPPKQRKKLPSPPEGLPSVLSNDLSSIDLAKYNQQAGKIHKYLVLSACRYCGRTFNKESCIVHQRGCQKRKENKCDQVEESKTEIKAPKTLVCCVCGQRFGLTSLKIHYPTCITKFQNEQILNHAKKSMRKNPPQYTSSQLQMINSKVEWSYEQIQDFNQKATQNYRNNAMMECQNCSRKFLMAGYKKHIKNCILINGVINKQPTSTKNIGQPQGMKETSMLMTVKSQKTISIQTYRKPKLLTCHICGRQYGLSSLSIHLKNCQNQFTLQQSIKLKHQRKKLPALQSPYDVSTAIQWSMEMIEQYNAKANQIYNTKSMSRCYVCGRTFFQESLPKHLKHCETKLKDMRKIQKFKSQVCFVATGNSKNDLLNSIIQANKIINNNNIAQSKRKPRTLICYLCGRQYGTKSLSIHHPNCQTKFVSLQEKKKESQRKQLPQISKDIQDKFVVANAEDWDDSIIEEYNGKMHQIYKRCSLYECSSCGRTFWQDALKKHEKHCQKQAKDKENKATYIKQNKIKESTVNDHKSQVNINSTSEQTQNSMKLQENQNNHCEEDPDEFPCDQHEHALFPLNLNSGQIQKNFQNLENSIAIGKQ